MANSDPIEGLIQAPAAARGRFEIQRRLGSGGMGVVYRALDRERGVAVALKTLREMDSNTLLRFKNEFRALADVAHPNLVTLYELLAIDHDWFFTMELVDGVHFIDFVCPSDRRAADGPSSSEATRPVSPRTASTRNLVGSADTAPSPTLAAPTPEPERPSSFHTSRIDDERLRQLVVQLIEGVSALHSAGKLHRDLKPSNVLVTREGRVVVCDFGLVADVRDRGLVQSDGSGTPAYMSPEQMRSEPLTEASDWYSVGIMLYEAAAGRVPFRGERDDMVRRKERLPPAPSTLGPNVSRAMDALCLGLLDPDPKRRWNGEKALAYLGAAGFKRRPTSEVPFVGRTAELARLQDALRTTCREQAHAVLIHGFSGMGKTALLKQFLDLATAEGALVLSGRCFDRESVPYRAMDGVVDSLAWYLKSLPRAEADALMPADLRPLFRLFPVLRRIDAVSDSSVTAIELADPHEVRRKGWYAFRELLRRLSERRRLIIAIDDIQWGDEDSARLLEQVLRPFAAPRILWVFCARREDLDSNPIVPRLRATARAYAELPFFQELSLDPLTFAEGSKLAASLADSPEQAATLARQSEGSPFLLHELARFRAGEGVTAQGLDDMLRLRVAQLPVAAQELLQTLAVAGRPVDWLTAQRALAADGDHPASLVLLRSQRLIKVHAGAGREQVETYHDRVRESVAHGLGEDRKRETHRRLAHALAEESEPDAQQLAEHWLEAGEPDRARVYAADAAQRAFEGLAFDQSARLARMAIDLGGGEGPESVPLWRLLGQALSNAARGTEATEAFLEGARRATGRDALDLNHLAGEQLLVIGELDRGRKLLAVVLRALGLRTPPTQGGAVWSLVWGRFQLWLWRLIEPRRGPREATREDLKRIDLCFTIALGLGFTETVRGADYQTQSLLMAVKAGEPMRLARAMVLEASFQSIEGQSSRDRVDRLFAEAAQLVQQTKDPSLPSLLMGGRALASLLRGDWRASYEEFTEGMRLGEGSAGIAFVRNNMVLNVFIMLLYLGRFRELSERIPAVVAQALSRGDVYLETFLRCRASYATALVDDSPAVARAHALESGVKWRTSAFHLQHHYQAVAESEIDLYEGKGDVARLRMIRNARNCRRALLFQMQIIRVLVRWRQAGGAVAQARRGGPGSRRLQREALALARKIDRDGSGYVRAMACTLFAAVADQRGQKQAAAAYLEEAVALFREAEMAAYQASAQRVLARVAGGDAGAKALEESNAYFAREGVRDPEKLSRVFCPGW